MSTPKAGLESYFYLSCRALRSAESQQISLPHRIGPTYTNMRERVLEVASALAFICVKESDDEVYAVGTRFSGDGQPAVIHIAGNNTISSETQSYLDDVVAQLTAIAQDQPPRQESQPFPNLDKTLKKPQIDHLVITVLRHTFKNFYRSLAKRHVPWNERIQDIRSEISASVTDTELFEKIEKILDLVYNLASSYSEILGEETHNENTPDENTPKEEALVKLSRYLGLLGLFVLKSKHKDQVSELLERIDRRATHPFTPETFPEHEADVDVDENNLLQSGFSMTRLIYRTLGTIIHIRQLLDLALSSKFQKFFLKRPTIQYCQPVQKTVDIDPSKILRGLDNKRNVLVATRPKESVEISLHAELVIFQTLIKTFLEGREPYWAIGVSKLMCFGCYTTICTAFREVVDEHSSAGLAPVAVQGTHGKIYPWLAPDLSFAENVLGFNLEEKMCRTSEEHIQAALSTYVETCCISDSSAGSGKSAYSSDQDDELEELLAEVMSGRELDF